MSALGWILISLLALGVMVVLACNRAASIADYHMNKIRDDERA